jgi:hypothetical protein
MRTLWGIPQIKRAWLMVPKIDVENNFFEVGKGSMLTWDTVESCRIFGEEQPDYGLET